MATGTNNPPGSKDPRDLYVNAQNLDLLLVGPQPFYPDRLGVQRYSWSGMEEDFTAAQDGRQIAFDAAQADRDAEFAQFLESSGYEPPVSYAAGVTLERVTQTFNRDGVQYRIKNLNLLPYTLSGNWASESGNFVVIGDSSLRQDLLAPGGSARVGTLAPGAGATARTVAAKLSDVVARADYSTDAAFQAARAGKPNIDIDGALDAPIRMDDNSLASLRELLNREVPVPPEAVYSIPSNAAYIDQFVDSFFARGMLTAETINVTTEQSVTAAAAVDSSTISITSTANLVIGGQLMVKHTNGEYWNYIITGMSGTTLTVFPSLRAPVDTSSKVERLWYNRAHPGKFYMRYLAQRIARGKESNHQFPRGRRIAYVDYGTGNTVALGGLTVQTGAQVNYYPGAPTGGSGTPATPPRFPFENTALVSFIASTAAYARTGLFQLREYLNATLIFTGGSDRPFTVTVLDSADRVLASKTINPPFRTTSYIAMRRTAISFFTGSATAVRVQIQSAAGANTSDVSVGCIEVFESCLAQGPIVTKPTAKIVGFGDSWVSGDTASTPERESFMTQLAVELPDAILVNAGIGGNKIDQMLARFDSDVAVHKPDYVIINTGTNEVYNPASATFDPTAINSFIANYQELLGRVRSIGARAIILGPPALAQSDAEVPSVPEWDLLRRSAIQYIRWLAALSDRPVAS